MLKVYSSLNNESPLDSLGYIALKFSLVFCLNFLKAVMPFIDSYLCIQKQFLKFLFPFKENNLDIFTIVCVTNISSLNKGLWDIAPALLYYSSISVVEGPCDIYQSLDLRPVVRFSCMSLMYHTVCSFTVCFVCHLYHSYSI